MRILLLSDNDYLLGFLKGYCINVGCDVIVIHNCNNFYNKLINSPPLLVFIGADQIAQLSCMDEWQVAQQFIKENHIILCGFGIQSPDNLDTQSNIAFEKFFPGSVNENEILTFLQEILIGNELLKTERRQTERRKRADRRKILIQMHDTSPSGKQQNSGGDINKGSLIINRAHKIVTINDTPVSLSQKEFKIIDYLATNSGSVVATKDIIKMVWPDCTRATKADVHQYIHMLRKKIEVDPRNPKLLITIKGFGYKICP